jgi:predicted DNA-binding transcriptional regulator AlpA
MVKSAGIPFADRLGLSRSQSAEYIGVSPSLFDELVADGRMPPPKRINARRVWSRPALEAAFAELPDVSSVFSIDDLWGNPA